jgi:hypothetical protein
LPLWAILMVSLTYCLPNLVIVSILQIYNHRVLGFKVSISTNWTTNYLVSIYESKLFISFKSICIEVHLRFSDTHRSLSSKFVHGYITSFLSPLKDFVFHLEFVFMACKSHQFFAMLCMLFPLLWFFPCTWHFAHSSDILPKFSNIRVLYVFLGFFKNTWKYLIQRPIFKPLYNYNVFLKILENTSFWAPLKNTRISYVTTMILPLSSHSVSPICIMFWCPSTLDQSNLYV